MSSNIYIENIQKYLLQFSDHLQLSNQSGLTNTSILAEDLFCPIFNLIFGYSLKNANTLTINQKAYDLFDAERKVYVQVTARKDHRAKYNSTIDAFQNISDVSGAELIIFYITKEIAKDLSKKVVEETFAHWGTDISWLMRHIVHLDVLKLEQIAQILQAELSPILLGSASNVRKNARQEIIAGKSGVYVKRQKIESELFNFSQQANGLLVGGPGYGKSLLINALQHYYYNRDLNCYIIRVNELAIGDKDEIAEMLGVNSNWIVELSKFPADNAGRKGLLIFDAFDTAKEEKLKSVIFKQIRTAIETLGDNWNILVSTRTYDAVKSFALQDLFPVKGLRGNITCRYMEVPGFSDEELKEIMDEYPDLARLAQLCTPAMRNLLKIPYFLGLFEQIVKEAGQEIAQISGIETESQLLSYYWLRNVESSTRAQIFAHSLTTTLMDSFSLSAEMHKVVMHQNTDAYEDLLRYNIVTTGNQGRRISFTHNILLEFAISRYILCEDVQDQVDLIEKNEKLPFLFMQSFLYFYNDLWQENRAAFYIHYFKIKSFSTPVFRLFHQTILNFVLISSYTEPIELQPLLDESDTSLRAEIVRKALESLRFIHKNALRLQDVKFLQLLTTQLHPILLWEVGYGIEVALKRDEFTTNNEVLVLLAKGARNYLKYVLLERQKDLNRYFVDANSGHWGIRNLAKTFSIDTEEAKALIEDVLRLLIEEEFPLTYFHTLSDCIEDIFKVDPDFGILVYKAIYLHNEISDKATNLGGAVLSLRSNRKQDYGSNYYILEKKYPRLLELDFIKAMQFGAEIVNNASSAKSYISDKLEHKVWLGDVQCTFSQNKSYYEDDEQHGVFTHGKAIFDFLKNADNSQIENTMQYWLSAIVASIKASSLWRKLFSLVQSNVDYYPEFAYELLANKIFFECDETLHEATELLYALWHLLTPEKQLFLEKQLLTIEHPEPIYSNPQWRVLRLKKIYSGLPPISLQLEQSHNFIETHGTSKNTHIVQSVLAMAKTYSRTPEERFIDAGFRADVQQDKENFERYEQIESFNSKFYNNQKPNFDNKLYKGAYEAARTLFMHAKNITFSNNQMQGSCDYAISNLASTLSKHIAKLSKAEITFIKTVSLYYLSSDRYKETSYNEGKLSDRSSGAYGPTARTAAAHTLINLLFETHDSEVKYLVMQAIDDNTKIVRFISLHALGYYWQYERKSFWDIIKKRCGIESDSGCMAQLISALCYDEVIDDDISTVQQAGAIVIGRLQHHDSESNREIWKALVVLLLLRLLRHDTEDAKKTIKLGLGVKEFCRNLCFEIRSSLNSLNGKSDFIILLERCTPFFTTLQDILEYRFNSIAKSGLKTEKAQEDFEIIDHVVQNIYFAVHYEKGNNEAQALSLDERRGFLAKFSPILEFIVSESSLLESGFMAAHTGYYFMKILNVMVDINPELALKLSAIVVECSAKNGFTYDRSTLPEIVILTEKLIVDHKIILQSPNNFSTLLMILDQFEQSGSQEALQLAWSLKELF